jgi:hypothetical protein
VGIDLVSFWSFWYRNGRVPIKTPEWLCKKYGVFTESLQSLYRVFTESLRSLYGVFTESFGVFTESLWSLSESIQSLYGVFTESLRSLYGVYMESIWSLYGVYVSQYDLKKTLAAAIFCCSSRHFCLKMATTVYI